MIKILIISFSLVFSLNAYSDVDPFEDINLITHNFNAKIDKNFSAPIAEASAIGAEKFLSIFALKLCVIKLMSSKGSTSLYAFNENTRLKDIIRILIIL